MPCDRCGLPGHSDNGCRVSNDPLITSPTLWTTYSPKLAARRTREAHWIAAQAHMQARFNQFYWHQPIDPDSLARVAIPAITPATTATMTHDEETTFQPRLLLRQADKTTIANPHLYHVVRPDFSTKTGDEVLTNHFPVTLPARIWVYDISGFPNPITRQRKKVLVETMFNCAPFLDTRGTPGMPRPPMTYVYDGNDRIVAWVDLFNNPTHPHIALHPATGLREVSIADVPSARSLNGGNELRIMTVRERVLGGVNLQTFRNTLHGNALTLPSDTSDDVTSLNAIISKAATEIKANNNYEFFPIGTNKFFLKSAFRDLGGGQGVLHAHTGFFSTIKPAMGQAVLNLNIATSAFYRPILINDYLNRVTGQREIRNRDHQGLRGVRVYINYERGTMPTNGSTLASLPMNQLYEECS